MITLYTFGPAFGLPDASPFVTKAEVLLKMAGLEYRTDAGGFRKAPKGKLPYIEDQGVIVPDSTFIRWHIEKRYGVDFDARLSARERGIAWAVEKLLEDNVYWAVLDARWMDDNNFARGPAEFFRSLPWPMRPMVAAIIRRKVGQALWAQGMGRHRREEIIALAAKGIESVAAVLGDKPYLMGDEPCGADATVFAFVLGLLCPQFETPLRGLAEGHSNLAAYAERMRQRYFAGVG